MLTEIEREKLRCLCEQNVRIKKIMEELPNLKELLERVIETGNLNLKNIYGASCLIYAGMYNLPGLAKFLLDHGANINTTSDRGETPLQYAIWCSNVEMVKLLIEYGSLLNTSTYDKNTIKETAKQYNNKEIIDLLENAEQIRQDFLNKTKEITLEEFIDEDKDKTPDELIEEARNRLKRTLTI